MYIDNGPFLAQVDREPMGMKPHLPFENPGSRMTQGRFDLDQDLQPGENKQLRVIRRDVKGKKAKVNVDIHYQ